MMLLLGRDDVDAVPIGDYFFSLFQENIELRVVGRREAQWALYNFI